MKKWDRPKITVIGIKYTQDNSINSRSENNRYTCGGCSFETGLSDATENSLSLMLMMKIVQMIQLGFVNHKDVKLYF